MKSKKKKYLHAGKVAKKLATLALVASALAQPAFDLVNVTSVYAQEAAAPAENREVKRTPIPFNTIYEEDPTLEAGQKRVRVKGVEGFKEVITTTTPDVAAVPGKGNSVLNFDTRAPIITTRKETAVPLTIAHIFDYSSSYVSKLKDSLRLSKKIIEANGPDSKHIFLTYINNYEKSYQANVSDRVSIDGFATLLLTKDEALQLIDKLIAINAPSEKDPTYTTWLGYSRGIANTIGTLRYKDKTAEKDKLGRAYSPFEDIIEKLAPKDKTISVIQYTDGWMNGFNFTDHFREDMVEKIDITFAEWAKRKAKTFMSVINRNSVSLENDTNSDQSLKQMRSVGHPNIYDMTGKDKAVAEEEIVEQFLETATESVTFSKGEDQTAKITIGGDGVKVLTVRLKGSINKELPIKDGKVDVSEKLADGSYSVEFTAEGNGTVTAKVAVDGKDVDTKTVTLKETPGQKGTSSTNENLTPAVDEVIQVGTKPVTKESANPFKTIYEEDKELEAGKKVTKQEGSAGSGTIVTTYTLNKQTGEVTPKEEKSDKPAQNQIVKVGTKPTVVETKIPYKTIEEKDPTLPEGERKVKTPGKEGLKTVTTTYTLNTENGEVTPKEEVKDEPKVDEVILVGTKKKALPVTLRFFNRDKGTFLKEDQKITTETSKFDDEFTLNPDKEIKDGEDTYRLVEIKTAKTEGTNGAKLDGLSEDKKSLKGKVSETEQMYDAVYERVVSTHFVDKEGKELEKPVEGVQEKKEIKDYSFVTTRKLQNGDIEHVYEKPAAPLKGQTPKAFAKTGEMTNWLVTSIGLAIAAVLGFLGFKKYQSSKKSEG